MSPPAAHTNPPPVLMVGWDAADLALIDQLCAAGRLPALQSLRARGSFGVLQPGPLLFAGGVWPTFYTGKRVPWHGIYHNRLWRQERMRCETIDAAWLPEPPFWEKLSAERRVAIVDVPMVVGEPRVINGVNLAGWATHDLVRKGAAPATLWNQVRSTFGPPALGTEFYGVQSAARLLRLRRSLLDTTEQMTKICEWLLGRERWDLFLVVFGAMHRGGHYLWDLSQTDAAATTPATRAQLESALAEIYEACDRGLGRLLHEAGEARVMVFALHGMGPNPGWSDRLPAILARIQAHSGGMSSHSGLLFRMKQRLPLRPIRVITNRIPQAIHDPLLALMSRRMFDWRTTKCFPVEMDSAGYLRINLKGREAQGIVNPGGEYTALCDEVEQALLTFRDIASGQRVVERVYRLDEVAPADAPYRHLLPDLLVTWGSPPAIGSPGVYSERYGEVRWADGGMLPSGRCGNHRSAGWVLAAGEGIPRGALIDGHGIVDLVPTALQWIGEPRPDDLQGVPIPALASKRGC
jgi:predicted AlkP superfamily phosphohydrolase/phosphomutase